MIQFLHDFSLINNWFYFLFSGKFVFTHDLHRIEPTCVFLPNKYNSRERASTDDLDLLKVMPRYFKVGLSVLCESQFGEVGSQKLSILEYRKRPVILS